MKADIEEKYRLEYSKYNHYIPTILCESRIQLFLESACKIEYSNISIELTPTSCKLHINIGKYFIMLNQPYFKPIDLDQNMIIFTIFEEKEHLISNAITIEELVKFNNLKLL